MRITIIRAAITALVVVIGSAGASAQTDFSGEWTVVRSMDNTENPWVGDFSANATLTEYFVRLVDDAGQEYLAVTTMVDDPQYLAQPYIKTYQYKKQGDATGWNPTPCSAK